MRDDGNDYLCAGGDSRDGSNSDYARSDTETMRRADETFRQRTCRYVSEVFRDRAAYVEAHWDELTMGFCEEHVQEFDNFIMRTLSPLSRGCASGR